MGLMDNLKAKAGVMKDRAGSFAQQHEARIGRGLDKAAKTVDTRTKGKYSAKIETGTGKAKDALSRLSHRNEDHNRTEGKDQGGDSA
ncbi:antitoxin [Streptomyces sp. NBRC 110028]|uniref:antitoxin n=1 Tax=Streptomyces sp. NBRC 110028 TaxID=1621260 RepID=UPI0006E25599|nr:antitoxin [Streptomyces sp. NBRC 110028]